MTAGLTPVDARPVCAEPKFRAIVDASFRKGGAQAAELIARFLCPSCPIRETCYTLGEGEHGLWGGVNRYTRTKQGQTPARVKNTLVNMVGVHQVRGTRPADRGAA